MKLLNIVASPRGEKSRTNIISSEFLKTLKEKHPGIVIEDLDLFKTKLPDVFGGVIDAKYASMGGGSIDGDVQKSWDEILKYSKEFLAADIYLITCPMWNFTIPYKLKQYIDIIMQAGVLFSFTDKGVEGLAKNKKMFCITSRGNDYGKETYMHQYDFQEPYLRAIFGLTGITDVSFVNAQPLDFAPGITEASLEKAKSEARALASNIN